MPIKWFTLKTIYVDIDTGEEIKEENYKKYYTAIKPDKKVWLNDTQKWGNIQWIMKCRLKNQLKLF